MPPQLPPLRTGHSLKLLQGAAEFFPALVAAVDAALEEVRIETYIFDFQGLSVEVASALERAARRGVSVKVVVDGFGTEPIPAAWAERFLEAGVDWRVYSPLGWMGMLWLGSWRRLHRKLCLIDRHVAFCGGINILDDLHDQEARVLPAPRFDFAVQVSGPLVQQIAQTMSRLWLRMQAMRDLRGAALSGALQTFRAAGRAPKSAVAAPPPAPGNGPRAALVLRDNLRNRDRIERAYRIAIGRAREEVLIANAYFVPGRKMRNALIRAALRGVRVQLLLQGRYESFMQFYASRPVYGALLRAGVEIHEYSASFLHAKVAVVDGSWATVGSSNLDPLSLLLAREANVIVENADFAATLRERLQTAIIQGGKRMLPDEYLKRPLRQRFMEGIALVLMRIALAVQGKKYL